MRHSLIGLIMLSVAAGCVGYEDDDGGDADLDGKADDGRSIDPNAVVDVEWLFEASRSVLPWPDVLEPDPQTGEPASHITAALTRDPQDGVHPYRLQAYVGIAMTARVSSVYGVGDDGRYGFRPVVCLVYDDKRRGRCRPGSVEGEEWVATMTTKPEEIASDVIGKPYVEYVLVTSLANYDRIRSHKPADQRGGDYSLGVTWRRSTQP